MFKLPVKVATKSNLNYGDKSAAWNVLCIKQAVRPHKGKQPHTSYILILHQLYYVWYGNIGIDKFTEIDIFDYQPTFYPDWTLKNVRKIFRWIQQWFVTIV